MNSSEKVEMLMKKGILVSPDLVDEVDPSIAEQLEKEDDTVVLDREKIQALKQKKKEQQQKRRRVRVLQSYEKEPDERTYQDFVKHFNRRFETMERMLKNRQELDRLTSIERVQKKDDRDTVSIIGLVDEKYETRSGNIMLTLEDKTGKMRVLITQDRRELYEKGRDLVLDEVIGVTGQTGYNIIFADSITFPDVPLDREKKKSPKEEYAVFISDVEVGSENFLEQSWNKFLAWMNGKVGDEKQKRISDKIKYLFIVGDLVAGVGVYPGQEEELTIPDIKKQYQKFAEYIKKIPDDVEIILCAGNHDAGRITEPQPPLYKDFAEEVYNLDNVTLVSNPALVNFGATESFQGFDTLLYHGYSLPYYADNIPSIRDGGGQKRADLVMKFYLQRRHLAPTHDSNMYIPDPEEDPLVIDRIPDFLATGHIHRTEVSGYRGVTTMNCSAWTGITEYQEKRGLEPQPGRAIIVNLKDRNVKIMKFLTKEEEQ